MYAICCILGSVFVFGCLDLYLGVCTCMFGVWMCCFCFWTCLFVCVLVGCDYGMRARGPGSWTRRPGQGSLLTGEVPNCQTLHTQLNMCLQIGLRFYNFAMALKSNKQHT